MCLTPITVVRNGREVQVGCRKCRQCRDWRVRDLVGRCIAESKVSKATSVVTLTYGNDITVAGVPPVLEAISLTYSDVQRWLKRIRIAGYPVRFFASGEYGSVKGRAHWHVILFWQETKAEFPLRVPVWDDPFWTDHAYGGHTFWDEFTPQTAQYVCKYLTGESFDKEEQSEQHMSLKPGLGHEYFVRLAHTYVEQGIVPGGTSYSFPEVLAPDGRPRKFDLSGPMLDQFCKRFCDLWEARYGESPLNRQHSEMLAAYLDRRANRLASPELDTRPYVKVPHIGTGIFIYGEEVKPSFDEKRNAYYYVDLDGQVWWWSYNLRGERAWHGEIVSEEVARARREETKASWAVSGESSGSDAYSRASQPYRPSTGGWRSRAGAR